jgi:PadR family transcriptional regulator PadR
MKRTQAVLLVAAELMRAPNGRHHGYEIGKHTGLRSGVSYPVLHRMLDEGWLVDGWEEQPTARSRKRPARRYYELTDLGRQELGSMPAPASHPQRAARVRTADAQ